MAATLRDRVVVIGDLNIDIIAAVAGPLRRGSDVDASIVVRGGGSAANTATWLAWLDSPVLFVGVVGDDPLGRQALEELHESGVTTAVRLHEGQATGACIVIVDPDGERSMLPDAGANATLRVDDLPWAALESAPAVLVSGYTLFRESSRPAAMAAMEHARAHGVPVFVDASSSGPIHDLGAGAVRSWTEGHVLLANADEALALVPEAADPREAARTLSMRHVLVVLKEGAAGAVVVRGGDIVAQEPAAPVDMVDTTGAGDAFAAGLLSVLDPADLTSEAAPSEWLRAATRTAAHAVGNRGARPA